MKPPHLQTPRSLLLCWKWEIIVVVVVFSCNLTWSGQSWQKYAYWQTPNNTYKNIVFSRNHCLEGVWRNMCFWTLVLEWLLHTCGCLPVQCDSQGGFGEDQLLYQADFLFYFLQTLLSVTSPTGRAGILNNASAENTFCRSPTDSIEVHQVKSYTLGFVFQL